MPIFVSRKDYNKASVGTADVDNHEPQCIQSQSI